MPKRINIQTVDVAYDESDPEGFRSAAPASARCSAQP